MKRSKYRSVFALLAMLLSAFVACAADYMVIAPKKYVELWAWYIGERAKMHPEISFALKDASEIYAEYPYSNDAGAKYRNPAESIHKFIREQATRGTKYFILGGVWFDAQCLEEAGKLVTGEPIDLDHAIPGIRAYPRAEKGEYNYPSDLFYACHYIDPKVAHPYPWDPDGDGIYCNFRELEKKEYFQPQVIVSRMDFVPGDWKDVAGETLNFAQLVTNYVAKLRRGEAEHFAGCDRYVAPVSYFDGYNDDGWPDGKQVMQRRLQAINAYHPAKELYLAACHESGSNTAEMVSRIINNDWEIALPFGHGHTDACAYINVDAFLKQKGLIKFFMANNLCFTGSVTTFNSEYGLVAAIAPVLLSNPNGGSLVSINNTLYGQCTDTSKENRYCGISDELLDWTLDGYCKDGKTAGEAWKEAICKYSGIMFGDNQSAEFTKRACVAPDHIPHVKSAIVEQMLFGDPLIRKRSSVGHILPRE